MKNTTLHASLKTLPLCFILGLATVSCATNPASKASDNTVAAAASEDTFLSLVQGRPILLTHPIEKITPLNDGLVSVVGGGCTSVVNVNTGRVIGTVYLPAFEVSMDGQYALGFINEAMQEYYGYCTVAIIHVPSNKLLDGGAFRTRLDLCPNGQYFARVDTASGPDPNMPYSIHSTKDGREIHTGEACSYAELSPDGRYLITRTFTMSQKGYRLSEWRTNKTIYTETVPHSKKAAEFLPGGRYYATAASSKLVDLHTQQVVPGGCDGKADNKSIRSYSLDGTYSIIAQGLNTACISQVGVKTLHQIKASGTIKDVGISANGSTVFIHSSNSNIEFYDTLSGQKLGSLKLNQSTPYGVAAALSSNGKHIIIGSTGNSIYIKPVPGR